MPPPGADCPAMVTFGLGHFNLSLRLIVPPTLKRMVRGVSSPVVNAQRSVPSIGSSDER